MSSVGESSSLALMALLLAFSFAGAANRFIDRQDLIVAEANAIGTAYLRADLLPDDAAAEVKRLLRLYTQNRIDLFHTQNVTEQDAVAAAAVELHGQIWQLVAGEMRLNSDHEEVVLPPVNELIDLHTTRIDAIERHLQPEVLAVLVLGIVVSMVFLGYANGTRMGGRSGAVFLLLLLLVAVLWVTIDMDYPRYGLLRARATPLEDLLLTMPGP